MLTNSISALQTGVGVYVPSMYDTVMSWHVAFDPYSNSSYLPLARAHGLRPNESTDFGVITHGGQLSNFTLTHVSTENQMWHFTSPGDYLRGPTSPFAPPPVTSGRVVDVARGGECNEVSACRQLHPVLYRQWLYLYWCDLLTGRGVAFPPGQQLSRTANVTNETQHGAHNITEPASNATTSNITTIAPSAPAQNTSVGGQGRRRVRGF